MELTYIILVIIIGPAPDDYALISFTDLAACEDAKPVILEHVAQYYPDTLASCVVSGLPIETPAKGEAA